MTPERLPVSGFVDLQVNGYRGVDFSSPDLSEESFVWACRALLRSGTTAFLPTLVSSPLAVYRRNLPLIARMLGREGLAGHLLGIHLEGPFISPEPGARGAHVPEHILAPDVELLERMLEWGEGRVRLLTIAAELDGAGDLIDAAVPREAVVSIGHSLATPGDLARAVRAGARSLTHLGNGLPNLLPRHENTIWAGLANDDLQAMVIGDGHHLPAPVLKTFFRAKGVGRTIVVSDASPLAGMPPGEYTTLGNSVVLEPSGRLYNPEKECLVGSSATMLQCMNHIAGLDLLDLPELLRVGYYNPLRLLSVDAVDAVGCDRLVFEPGSRAFSLLQ